MKHRLILLTILLASISESSGQEKLDLTGTWVLQKVVIKGQKAEHKSDETPIDTLLFSGENFREATLVRLSAHQNIIGTRTGTYKILEGKLELKNLESQTNQSTASLPDETVPIRIKKNEIVIERQITMHTGQTKTKGTSLNYYKKIK